LCTDYKNTIDWNNNPLLAAEIFINSSTFDALNRPLQMQTPDSSIVRPVYNEAGILNEVYIRIKGMPETQFVKNINYDAKGQRQSISYANNTKTNYQYDPKTLRLTQLSTTGKNGTDILQKLHYTYDPAGNITTIKDEAQQTIFFNNSVVNPSNQYTYDAIYRLISATGREHIGQNQSPSAKDEFRTNLPMPGDGSAMRNYTQQYEYDAAGNILRMIHAAGAGSWTRLYSYETINNRLKNNTVNNITESYSYDEHGNIQSLSHLSSLHWNFKDQLQQVNLGGGGMAYYVYDVSGQRIRKVIERLDGSKEERLYLGDFEVYKKTDNSSLVWEQTETLHVVDDSRRIAIVETKTIKDAVIITSGTWQPLIRYQYSNHLGSSSLELDENASIISYEEYHPFGTTSYQAKNASINAAAKRYRYTGMERDEESGLAYHSARYYLPWLGRWLSADPIGIEGGLNLYGYSSNNPINRFDINGQNDKETEYCFIPGCGTFAPRDFIKDVVFGSAEGVADTGIELYEQTENLKWAFIDEMNVLIKDPEQFIKDIENMPTAMLDGMKQQLLHIADQASEYYEAVEQGRYRTAARILAKHASNAAIQIALSEVGGELLSAGKVATETSLLLRAEVKAVSRLESRALSTAERKAVSSVEGKAAATLEKNLPKAKPSYSKAPPQLPTANLKPVLKGQPANVNGITIPNLSFKEPGPWKWRLRTPQYKPEIDVLQHPVGSTTVKGVIAHEKQHALDMLTHPQFSYLAGTSRVPGKGIASYIFEARGYFREYGLKGLSPKYVLNSLTSTQIRYLAAEVTTILGLGGYQLSKFLF
jgi:RHS repeat-associated protein